MKLINLTPHTINYYRNGRIISIPADLTRKLPRISSNLFYTGDIHTRFGLIKTVKTEFFDPENIPNPEKNTLFIVSRIIKEQFKDRDDFLVPSEIIRSRNGQIIGCNSLSL